MNLRIARHAPRMTKIPMAMATPLPKASPTCVADISTGLVGKGVLMGGAEGTTVVDVTIGLVVIVDIALIEVA